MAKIDPAPLTAIRNAMQKKREEWQKQMMKGGNEGEDAANKAVSAKTDIANIDRVLKRVSKGFYND